MVPGTWLEYGVAFFKSHDLHIGIYFLLHTIVLEYPTGSARFQYHSKDLRWLLNPSHTAIRAGIM